MNSISKHERQSVKWFDKYTKILLAVMFVILLFIFASGKYMDRHKMEAGGTDDSVNNMASKVTKIEHHPFIELPGDAEVGAFSVANFFAGLIVGHHWEKLFGESASKKKEAHLEEE
ncbi:hypothetical protein ACJDU8_15485 [Clostridium sp. WILCCON 0269]|uniref:Uncharacterized protein n=1 Tax=Candidatus Clostridium eludens TaxID=3381663 RepID=A0ABW8SQJ5_9CLOT